MQLKSKITKKSELNYDKEFVLTKLSADQNILKQQEQKLIEMFKDSKPEEIKQRLMNIVIRDNMFNLLMEDIVSHFSFNFDKEEIKHYQEEFKKMFPNREEKILEQFSTKMIQKTLIFAELAKLWDIRSSDEEAKEYLQSYYKQTNQPIREILENKEKFENIKNLIRDEKITGEILRRFRKCKVELEKKENKQ